MDGVLKENKKESEKKQEAPTTIWALSELCPSNVKVSPMLALSFASALYLAVPTLIALTTFLTAIREER